MTTDLMTLPDPIVRFTDLYKALNPSELGWTTGPWQRFAAFAAMLAPGDATCVAKAIAAKAILLERYAPWYSALASPMRFALAATLVNSDSSIHRFEHDTDVLRERLHAENVHAGGDVIAIMACVIAILEDGHPISALRTARVCALHHECRAHAWGRFIGEDLPLCLLLSYRTGKARDLAVHAKAIDQSLDHEGIPAGPERRAAASLLLLAEQAPIDGLSRFSALLQAYRQRSPILLDITPEVLASLATLPHPPALVMDTMTRIRERLLSLEPSVPAQITEVLAGDLTFLSLIRVDAHLHLLANPAQRGEMFRTLRQHYATSLILACDAMSEVRPIIQASDQPYLLFPMS